MAGLSDLTMSRSDLGVSSRTQAWSGSESTASGTRWPHLPSRTVRTSPPCQRGLATATPTLRLESICTDPKEQTASQRQLWTMFYIDEQGQTTAHMCRYVRVHKSLSSSQHPRHALSLTLSENVEIISGEGVMQFTRLSTEGTRSLADLAQDSNG